MLQRMSRFATFVEATKLDQCIKAHDSENLQFAARLCFEVDDRKSALKSFCQLIFVPSTFL